MKSQRVNRILFFVNDFKTDHWGDELKSFNYEVLSREYRFFSHVRIIVKGYFNDEKVTAFVFRYLNDHKSLYHSTLLLLRDILIICACKLFQVKILWILHNIDRETEEYYPSLSHLRRTLIHLASKKVFVTDPNFVQVAKKYGIAEDKVDWLCFGKPIRESVDSRNRDLKVQIAEFRKRLENSGNHNVYLGLCVSEPAKKKLHYLYADSIVGPSDNTGGTLIGLVMIGKFPKTKEFERAKQRVQKSQYILFIDHSYHINETYISDQIDFFYRSLNDQSIPYTLYISADLKKPMVTFNSGALPMLIKTNNLGSVINLNEKNMPLKIAVEVENWSPEKGEQFLQDRSWRVAAKRLVQAIEE